ncbi:MAG: MarC family protein [Nanoarchaeota archaeon]
MLEIIQLTILFIVLFDPLASLAVFFIGTKNLKNSERKKVALYAVLLAGLLSYTCLLFGDSLLTLLNTNLDNIRIAGGIILIILGIRMSFGYSLFNKGINKNDSVHSIAALIATPLLTGPAVITAIIVLKNDFGFFSPAISILITLMIAYLLFYNSEKIFKIFNETTIQVISTFLGLITIAWGVGFLRVAIGF